MALLELLQQRERMAVVATRARLTIEPRHRLEVVVHHVGRSRRENLERALEATAKIGDQDLDCRAWRAVAHRANAVYEMLRSAILQVVAIDARHDDVPQLEPRDRFSEVLRLL